MTSPASLHSTFGIKHYPRHDSPRQQQEQQQLPYYHSQPSQYHFNEAQQEINMEQVEEPLPDQLNHSPRNENHYPHHYQHYHQQGQHRQYAHQPYHNLPQSTDESNKEIEGNDGQDQDEENEHGDDQYHHPYGHGARSAYNSAYNSENEDINMDGVALRGDLDLDHDMTDLPSSSSASSSSCSLTTTPALSSKNSIAATHKHCPYPPQQLDHSHRPQHSLLPAPSSSPSATSPNTPSKAKQSNSSSAAVGALAIKPRPALRPLLPSRPTSPQPMIPSRSNNDSDNTIHVGSGPSSSSMSSSSRPQNSAVPLFGSTNTSTSQTGEATSSASNNDSTSSTTTVKTRQSAYKINGLNILNRNSLDSRTALEMIRRRRENHNHVERRRRDTLNSTILNIAEILPNCTPSAKLNKGTILRLALDHLRSLHAENHSLRSENAALRFFYQGPSTKRPESRSSGPSGPSPPLLSLSSSNTPAAAPFSLSHSHPSSRGFSMSTPSLSQMSNTSIPPIIPGPGKGMIPALEVRPGSAANSPPGQHLPFPAASANISGHFIGGAKRSMSANGHLQPVSFRNQQPSPRMSPSPGAHSRKGPGSGSGIITSSPCPSPTMETMSMPLSAPQPVSAPMNAIHAMANALPSVPASHQHSAAVSAAAAAAAAAASRASSGTPQPSPLVRHQKSHSGESSSSSHSGAGYNPLTMHHHHHHHHHHHSPQQQSQSLQMQTQQKQPPLQLHPLGPGSHGSYPGHGTRLPSLESLTDSSSPMTSPRQGPNSSLSRASPSLNLPGPMDSLGQHQHQQQQLQRQAPNGQGQPPSYNRVHPLENLNHPTLPPITRP
ncbi:hypothetical protein EMPS_09252 [Entomortierella parvispora]|uniref:BHLH domain-containing protein n=1 Tax=Entomortierella parvispora TaxID=205924 RepID=A0A9P3HI77_9FUNG|nr:hypothetical protein EMPS_09252 [Entomortierella parvispora]